MRVGIVIFALTVLAMGNLGAPGIDQVPETDRNFMAIVVDKMMVSTQLEMVSFDGETLFVGYRGKGEVSVSFEKVKHAAFKDSDEPSYQLVKLTLKDDQIVEIKMKNILVLHGMSELGPYRIKVKDISSLSFLGEKEKPQEKPQETKSK